METIFPNGRQGRQGCGESPVLRETGRGDRETEPPFQGLPVPSCLLHWHTSTLDFPSCRPCLPFKKRGLGSKRKIQRVCGGAYLHRSSRQPHCLEASPLLFGPHRDHASLLAALYVSGTGGNWPL